MFTPSAYAMMILLGVAAYTGLTGQTKVGLTLFLAAALFGTFTHG